MLIDYKYLKSKFDFKPTSVLHIGGHRGEEQPFYDDLGVLRTLWFEAIPESAEWMTKHFQDRGDVRVIQACLSDGYGFVDFQITNNYASSSMLELGTHLQHHPKIYVEETKRVWTEPLEVLMAKIQEKPKNYDTMNIDVQGAELKVLKGYGKQLYNIKYIYCEVNREELYKGCCLVHEIDNYLGDFGFNRVETMWTDKQWGDALYIK